MPDESTYGFSKPDAEDLLQLIGNVEQEHAPTSRTGFFDIMVTTIDTIAPNTSGQAYLRTQTAGVWSDTATQYTVNNATSTSLPAGTVCFVSQINGLWCAFGVC